nr:retrovirus-related Pol polyprotein [Tanacetum cinerariifolium]
MEDDFKPTVQHQRRVNPKIHEVIKEEVIKLLDAGLIYPISVSPWVIHVHVVPKRRMPFGLCNALGTFQRCMVAIFHDMIEKSMDVFMDDFSVFGDSFSSCLSHLDMMLKWCEDTNLVLNLEKCYFMVKEKLAEAPICVSPDWDLSFELMCDDSDFAVGAVLGQRKDKYFRPKHYVRAENLVADHLSRLENPHQGDLVRLEMNDNFSHESFNMISLNPDNEPSWFADIANYLVGNVLVKRDVIPAEKEIL